MDHCQYTATTKELDDLRRASREDTQLAAQLNKELNLRQREDGGNQQYAYETAQYETQLGQIRVGMEALNERIQAIQEYFCGLSDNEGDDDDSNSNFHDEQVDCDGPRDSDRKRKRGKPRYFRDIPYGVGIQTRNERIQAEQEYLCGLSDDEGDDDDRDSDYDDELVECDEPRDSGRKRKRGKPRYFRDRDGYYYNNWGGARHGRPYIRRVQVQWWSQFQSGYSLQVRWALQDDGGGQGCSASVP